MEKVTWMDCVCPAGTLAKVLGRIVTNGAISGTASTVTFVKPPLLTKLSALEEFSPGERVGCTELADHVIFGWSLGEVIGGGRADGCGLAVRNKENATIPTTTLSVTMTHLM